MARKTMDSETRWERRKLLYNAEIQRVLSEDIPQPLLSFIYFVREHFQEIREAQEEAYSGGGSLNEYEAQLVIALASLGERFSYLILRELMEKLFDDVLNADRIVAVPAGEQIFNDEHRRQFRDTLKQIKSV